ncbi:recombinase family protein [Streptomyces sp. AJS327]|uniref:recombinase family protein n=1 Tax=Streptomyces sp. AJS327 TaxID=2545265 RepID=UPI0015E023CD|nr:recombinase family protein [Streptomyces sp. AJS327]MBA0054280.1 recombinase family protein [Streptomyces sp. AJS327]
MSTTTVVPATFAGHQLRALSGIRLSVKTDETTSPARQRVANGNEAARRGAVIVGEAEDLDVSASKTTPFERPELAAWLARPDDYDMIIWWRMDRAVRSMADMAALGRWAKEHGKLLVFAEGPGGAPLELDMRSSSPVAELIMMLLAFAAQMEATAIRERVTGAMAALRAQGRYAGGLVPFGYKKVKNPDGPGWKLEPDADSVAVLERIIRDVLDGKSLTAVSMELNEEEVLVPRDYQAQLAGRSTGGKRHGRLLDRFRWSAGTLSKVLRSPALMGHRIHKGKTVRDHDGAPVLIGQPVLERQEFELLQARLASMTPHRNRTRKDTKALLLGVAKCAGCGYNMYRVPRKGYTWGDYVCRANSRGVKCPSQAGIRSDWLEMWVEVEFLKLVGPAMMTRSTTYKGYDPTPELREVEQELRALYADKESRKSRTGRMIWEEEVATLERRAEHLENTPIQEARTIVEETGETYAQFWRSRVPVPPRRVDDPEKEMEGPPEPPKDSTDLAAMARYETEARLWERYEGARADARAEQRQLLLDAGAVVTVSKGKTGGGAERLQLDESRLTFTIEREDPVLDTVMYDLD